MDKYQNYLQLKAGQSEGKDYRIRLKRSESRVAVIAPHGGKIEPMTSEIAETLAGDHFGFYSFEGCKDNNNGDLHITSTHFDEPKCMELLANSDQVLAIHGLADREGNFAIDVGGNDHALRDAIAENLRKAGFAAQVVNSGPFAATSPENICNKGARRVGTQLELTRNFRNSLKDHERMRLFVSAISAAFDSVKGSP